MALQTLGFVPASAVTYTGSGNWTGNSGFTGANTSTQIAFEYSEITGISIDDDNDTFDDDPNDPHWSGSGSEVGQNGIVRHRQVNGDEFTVGNQTFAPGTLQIEAEYRVNLLGDDGKLYELIGVTARPYIADPSGDVSKARVGQELGIIGFTFSGPNGWPPEGVTLNWQANAADGPSIPWVNIPTEEEIPCFTTGTLIETPEGLRRVEELVPGDLVLTLDNGAQPVRWIGRKALDVIALAVNPNLRPIRIKAGALGRNVPAVDLVVSPQHRVLIRSKIAERIFGASEVLVAAKQLLVLDGIEIATDLNAVEYVHILFDRHEVVNSNGAETESLYSGAQALKALGPQVREELEALFPEICTPDFEPTGARPLLSGRMGRKLAMRHAQNDKPLITA